MTAIPTSPRALRAPTSTTTPSTSWHEVLRDFWVGFSEAIAGTSDLTITDVINWLDDDLGPHFFPEAEPGTEGGNPRKCPACEDGRLGLKLGNGSGERASVLPV